MPTIPELARQFKAAIDRQDSAALGRLAKAYAQLYGRMQVRLDSLLLAISKIDQPTKAQVFRLAQFKNLIDALEVELKRYSAFVEVEIQTNASALVSLAVKQTDAYLAAAGYTTKRSLPTNSIIQMLGFLDESGPLYKRIGELAPYHVQRVTDALLEAAAFGYNPAKTARMFEKVMGGGLTDAMRMTRTAQLYASREASRATYNAYSDVVAGWQWNAGLDDMTCMACVAEHGTIHPLDEPMSSHYNCRCTSLPVVIGYNDQMQTGADWFNALPEEKQVAMMGKGAWEAWREGKFQLSDMVGTREDEVYGDMKGVKTLKELLEE